jgi:hypothetical protein
MRRQRQRIDDSLSVRREIVGVRETGTELGQLVAVRKPAFEEHVGALVERFALDDLIDRVAAVVQLPAVAVDETNRGLVGDDAFETFTERLGHKGTRRYRQLSPTTPRRS